MFKGKTETQPTYLICNWLRPYIQA